MKKMLRLAWALLLILPLATVTAMAGTKGGDTKTVYAFGFSTSLNDSTVYLTPIVTIPGATLDRKTKFLNERQAYTHQLRTYMESKYAAHQTSVVLFADSRKKLENKYVKMRRTLLKKKHSQLVELEAGAFAFAPVTLDQE